MAFQIFKPFLSDKMRKQIYIHGSNMDSLHRHIDKSRLPMKYGGEMPEFPYTAWMENLAKNDKVMEELKLLGYEFNAEEFRTIIWNPNNIHTFILLNSLFEKTSIRKYHSHCIRQKMYAAYTQAYT